MSLWVDETWINRTEGYSHGESGVHETYCETEGELFREMRDEYGRCVSKVYIGSDENVRAVGWVFQKRVKYEDSNESYLQETWVTVHDKPPTITREDHLHVLGSVAA